MSPKRRPEFSLPSIKPVAGPAAHTEWVYRSDESHADPVTPVVNEPVALVATDARVQEIIGTYASLASGAGIIPLPWLDVLAIGAIQLKMLSELCAHYRVPFNSELGKSLIAAMVGSYGTTRLAAQVCKSLLKAIPLVGTIGTSLTMSMMAYGATWAIGKVFAMHLQNGGSLLDVDVTSLRTRYQDELAAVR